MKKVGFIGLGYMGEGMATCLIKKGFSLTVLGHRNRQPIEKLLALGAKEVSSAKDMAASVDIIFMCVTGSPQVEENFRSSNGILAGAKKGLIVVDCSTSNPVSTLALYEEAKKQGVTLVDAPLGGTPKQAHEGLLSTMVGCDEALFNTLTPILSAFSASNVCMGSIGKGHQMKLINNFMSMGYAALYSEALSIAAKAGITPQTVDNVIRGGRMDCGFYQTFFKYVLERDENAHLFTIKNGHKDVRYLAALADSLSVPNPVGSAVRNVFALAEAQGAGDKFIPMLSDVVASQNNVKLT